MLQRRKGEGSAASSWTKLARGRYTKWAQRTHRNFEVRLISTSRCKINMSRSSVRDQGRLLMILKSRTSKEQIALGKMACLPWTWRDTWIRIHIWSSSLMSSPNNLLRQMDWNLQIFKTLSKHRWRRRSLMIFKAKEKTKIQSLKILIEPMLKLDLKI